MSNPSLFYALALVACISIMAAPTLAHLPDGRALGWLGGGVDSPAIEQCLEGIRGVQGCIQELISSFFSLQPQTIGPACCKAFLDVDETCLPKIFPFHLDFFANLKNDCVSGDDSPTTPDLSPPPPPCSDDDDEGEDCDYDNYEE